MNPSVGIILLNWNDYKHTSACLDSLEKLDYENYKSIVVDNNSCDDSLLQLIQTYPNVHFIQNNQNLGFTGGNNVGIRYALKKQFEHILLLNNDTIVEPDFLRILVNKLESDPKIGAVQPKIMYNSERDMIWSAGGRFNTFFTLAPTRGYREKDIGQYDTQTEMDWISCCAFLIRSEVLTKIGLEDEIFFYGCFDDVDLSLRVRKVGYKLFYYPQSVIYHDVMSAALSEGRTDGNIKPFFHYLVTRNHWFFIRKHTPLLYLPSSIVYQLIKFFAYSVNFVLRCRFVKFRAFMHGFIHGIVQPLESEKLKHEKYILKYR